MESTYTHAPELVSKYSEDNILFCEILRLAVSDSCSMQRANANNHISVDAIHWLESNDSNYFFHLCNVNKQTALNSLRKGYRVGGCKVNLVPIQSLAPYFPESQVLAIIYKGSDSAQVAINESSFIELMPIGEGIPSFIAGKLNIQSIKTNSNEVFALVKVK